LNNAIKFTARGGVVIRVQRRPALPGPDTAESCPLHFEVQDSGIGIDESQRARLFESFEQGDQSTTRNFGGTGLGLAISRQLAHLMDGEIGMASRLGEGSTFWFDARFQIAHEARQQVRPPTSVQDAINALRGKQVLVVDDNDFNLDVARGLLEDIGVQVATAENGAQAVDAVRQTHFDCVLMDMQMPVMDGLVATRTIRSQPATAGMVVIAMTANAGQEDQRLCMQAGMNQVLTKPIEPDLLFLALAHWLQAIGPPSVPLARRAVSEVPGIQPVPADASALPVWDARALTRMVGDNQAAHARLLDKYLLTAGETLATLRSCANACQWTGVADQAHKLKSSSRSVGAMQLGALCETLERAGRGSSGDQCATLVQSVEQCFAQVQSQISAHRSAS
jgi:CheY-like chemotaxis protein/HPt (histidine-containing phosphotransfer) domain-containing protein